MNDLITSLIRTYVPIIVGLIASYLFTLGVELDLETQTGLIVALAGLFQAIYYLVIRLIERKYPKAGVFLGVAKKVEYSAPKTVK